MGVAKACKLIGGWRIVEADLWKRDHLDVLDPAAITIGTGNHGEMAFGAMCASLDLSYSIRSVSFRWRGSDDLHEVAGEGYADLQDDSTVEITLTYDDGDEAILKARPFPEG